MWTQANDQQASDQVRLATARFVALHHPVSECYCGLGPSCPLWRAYTPAQRAACAQDQRATAQARWMNGM